jgi:hypothetical protein
VAEFSSNTLSFLGISRYKSECPTKFAKFLCGDEAYTVRGTSNEAYFAAHVIISQNITINI